ncbi:flagellar hook-length control protein FliK [Pseudomonas daroniae]|uniref:Flagellar hook-length control protein FliK n=1 Tax=Phytopseudomonas daroniae TaxID=2487519 RepID=A0A4Q9QP26_9GAMM|nr:MULTISPECIES: flagellar hook-length control protein FliK [Pseudomonas]TBU81948.1 flagellar hook-length control protein FliK [Pseudomonas daroniae]TBU84714.1 flagellar hook-length control protein FliK [Pseudomonas sp. FRB 228]TBU92250.1 flagellar hook-length control protein FliK [Pseudomonas daroniae]
MTEISGSRPIAAPPPTSRPQANAADLAVKLLQPLDGLMASGESAKAEVLALKEVAQNFQLLLRVTLENGRQATLQASSPQAIAQGTALAVTALSESRLSLAVLAGGNKPLTSIDLEQLPVGTLLQGKVISREALPAQASQTVYKVLVNLLNTSLAGSKLSLETNLDLPLGSLLSARVQGDQSLAFLPLSGRLDQLALLQQLGTQQSRQGSLEGLLSALQGMGNLPDGLRGSIDKLLGGLPSGEQMSNGKGLMQALENSGLFLESKLLGGQTGALSTDMKANLLRLVSQLLPLLPGAAPLAAATASAMTQALPAFARNILGNIGQSSGRQQAMSFPLPSRLLQAMDGEADLETLLKLAAAAISRLQTHQLSSLAQSQTGPDGALLTTWQMEVPMRNQHELVPLQVKIQHEEPAPSAKQDSKEALWRIDLAFDLDPLGPLQVQAQLAQGTLSSQLWAERASTAGLIDRELGNLRERLVAAGLTVGDLACSQGIPPQGPKTSLEQRWVDETA